MCPEMCPWYTESLEGDLQQVIEAARALETNISHLPDTVVAAKEEDGCEEEGKQDVKR